MKTPKSLETYLTQLNDALGKISVSERADIITEIKSHVLDAAEREPQKSIDQILSSLGEPESVANRYLIERGLSVGKPSKSPMIKWLTIGVLGTFAIFSVLVLTLVFRFTPLIEVNDATGNVRLLGGAIHVSEGDIHVENSEGSMEVDPKKVKQITLKFANGKFDIRQAVGNTLKWDCKGLAMGKTPGVQNNEFLIDSKNIKCDLFLPEGIAIHIRGTNGKIDFQEIASPIDLELGNGKVEFLPAPKNDYRYEIDLKNGKSDHFESSDKKTALLVKMKMTNGMISND